MSLTPLSSYAWQLRFAGTSTSQIALVSGGCIFSISVSMNPGEMVLTRQKSIHSTASDFDKWISAALEALY